MAAPKKIQYFIFSVLVLLLLIYSMDRLNGVPHASNSIGLMKSKQWVSDTRNTLRYSPKEVVVLGNSMVGWGFDELLFSQLSNHPTISIWRKGTASAWFYMALKNLILANGKPRNIVIIFRDNVLTRPEQSVWGQVKNDIDALVQSDSALLDELAYLNHKNANYYFSNYVPLYAERSLWSDKVKFMIEEYVSRDLLEIELSELILSLNNLFTFDGIKYREIANQSYYSSTLLEPENLRFSENIKTSFLPHIVQLCKRHEVNLITVRIQRLVDLEKLRDTKLIDQYIEDFSDYAEQEGFVFIDSTGKGWLQRDHYATNDHLIASGKQRFTRVIFRELQTRNLLESSRQ